MYRTGIERRRVATTVACAFATLLVSGCGGEARDEHAGSARGGATPASAAGPGSQLRVVVTNYPLQYLAERIGGDAVRVEFPATGKGDPAFWIPDAGEVAVLQQADLVFLNGAGYEPWLSGVSLQSSRLVNTSAEFRSRYVEVDDRVTHRHGPEGEHEHGGAAFTTWLDPSLASRQARAVYEALASRLPSEKTRMEQDLERLEGELAELHVRLARASVNLGDVPVLASHPVYQYLAVGLVVDVRSVHFEPDEHPEDRAWEQLDELLAGHPARIMLWEDTPLDETRNALVERGIESVVFSPCADVPPEGDYLDVMKANVERLEAFASDS